MVDREAVGLLLEVLLDSLLPFLALGVIQVVGGLSLRVLEVEAPLADYPEERSFKVLSTLLAALSCCLVDDTLLCPACCLVEAIC